MNKRFPYKFLTYLKNIKSKFSKFYWNINLIFAKISKAAKQNILIRMTSSKHQIWHEWVTCYICISMIFLIISFCVGGKFVRSVTSKYLYFVCFFNHFPQCLTWIRLYWKCSSWCQFKSKTSLWFGENSSSSWKFLISTNPVFWSVP